MEQAPIVSIGDLQPGMINVNIRVKVIYNKSFIAKPDPKPGVPVNFHKILLADSNSIVFAFCYEDNRAEEIFNKLEKGSSYNIWVEEVRCFNPLYSTGDNEQGIEIVIRNPDNITPCDPVAAEETYPFRFKAFDAITFGDEVVDVVGFAGESYEVQDGMEVISFNDGVGRSLTCCVWTSQMAEICGPELENCAFAVKGARVAEYDDELQLHFGNTCEIFLLQDMDYARRLVPPNLHGFLEGIFPG